MAMTETTSTYDGNSGGPVVSPYAAFRRFISAAPHPYLFLDETGLIVYANPAFDRLMRNVNGAYNGTALLGIIAAESKQVYFKVFRSLLSSGGGESLPLALVCGNGRRVSVVLHCLDEYKIDEAPRHILMAVTCHDDAAQLQERAIALEAQLERRFAERIRQYEQEIEERRRTEQLLQESQERLSLALWGGHIAWWEYEFAFDRLTFGPRIAEVLGRRYQGVSLSSQDMAREVHAADAQESRIAFKAHLTGKRAIFDAQLRVRTSNNEWKWIAVRGRITSFDGENRATRMIGILQDISESKQIEQERNLLFMHSLDMLAIMNREGVFRQVNPAWERIMGWLPAEMIGRPAIEFTHPDHKEAGGAVINALRHGRRPALLEQRVRCKNGAYRWLSCATAPLEGHEISIVIARDITDQKEQDRQLRALNETLELRVQERSLELLAEMEKHRRTAEALELQKSHLVKAMKLGRICDWAYDPETGEFILNARFAEMLRLPSPTTERISAEALQPLLIPRAKPGALAQFMAAAMSDQEEERFRAFEMSLIFGDGQKGHARVEMRIERDGSGKATYVRGIAQDVSGWKQLEQDLQYREALYSTLVSTAPDVIFIADATTGMLLDANKKALEFTGCTVDALRAMHFTQLHKPEELEEARTAFEKVVEKSGFATMTLHLRRGDGGFSPVHIVANITRCGDHTYAIAFMRDIRDISGCES